MLQSNDIANVSSVQRILVVEDIKINQLVARKLLESRGYYVDIAENGKETFETLQNNKYDAILLDIGLPDIGGLTICKTIRQTDTVTPIIFCTASGHASEMSWKEAGGTAFTTKPIIIEELIPILETCILDSRTANTEPELVNIEMSMPVKFNLYDLTGKFHLIVKYGDVIEANHEFTLNMEDRPAIDVATDAACTMRQLLKLYIPDEKEIEKAVGNLYKEVRNHLRQIVYNQKLGISNNPDRSIVGRIKMWLKIKKLLWARKIAVS
jgi:CheY-like chemotaxis protein